MEEEILFTEEETLDDDDDLFFFNYCCDGGGGGDHFPEIDYNEEEEEDPFCTTTTTTTTTTTVHQIDYETDDTNKPQLSIGLGSKEDSFASDFYRSGTDWSCLLHIDNNPPTPTPTPTHHQLKNINTSSSSSYAINNNNGDEDEMLMRKKNMSKKRLKQTNLFQMWGASPKINNPFPPKSHMDAAPSPSPYPAGGGGGGGFSLPLSLSLNNSNSKRKSNQDYYVGGKWGQTSTIITNASQRQQRPRLCPFYKKLPGTPFTVDAFRYGNVQGCSAYFLSHFHADHYGGLSKRWSHGPIYCTPLTARLVIMLLSVNPSLIHPLELGREIVIEGIKVTMLEANHCPGAALIHFRLPNGQSYLHTGDFRASKLMQSYPILLNQRINALYLDTTYCNPKYRFPSKEDVLNFVVSVTKNFMKKQSNTLVIVGAYSIGKECVYLAISKALGVKVYANPSRRRILQSFGWPEISGNLCMHGKDTPLHVLPISSLKFETLEQYLKTYMGQYKSVLAFRPTGWTYSERIGSQLELIKPTSKGRITIYGVPYSEHSSFTELREFVQFLRPEKIIPTVNVGNADSRDKMQSYFREWMKGT